MASNDGALSPLAVVVPILAGSVIILDIPPLVWHFRNRNVAACSLVLWLLASNYFICINALIWPNDNRNDGWSGEGLCDFEAYFWIAAFSGTVSSLLCIMRNLAKVMDTKRVVVTPSRKQRMRQFFTDLLICWAPPCIQIGLFDIVKYYRFNIQGLNGCIPSVANSWLSLVLVYMWPVIIGLGVAFYAVLVIVRLQRYRTEFSRLIENSNTTRSRFVRLFLLSSIFILGILPMQAYIMFANVSFGLGPYSWSTYHGDRRHTIAAFPPNGNIRFDRWTCIASGLLLFLFFGLGTDAAAMYRSWLVTVNPKRLFGCFGHAWSRHSSSGASISSPTRTMFSGRSFRSSVSTTKSFFNKPFNFLRSLTSTSGTEFPTHDSAAGRVNSTATAISMTPTIDTTISTTPLGDVFASSSASPRQFSINTSTDDATLMGSPASDKRRSKMFGYEVDIEMGSVSPTTTFAPVSEERSERERAFEQRIVDRLCLSKGKDDPKLWRDQR